MEYAQQRIWGDGDVTVFASPPPITNQLPISHGIPRSSKITKLWVFFHSFPHDCASVFLGLSLHVKGGFILHWYRHSWKYANLANSVGMLWSSLVNKYQLMVTPRQNASVFLKLSHNRNLPLQQIVYYLVPRALKYVVRIPKHLQPHVFKSKIEMLVGW